MLITRCICTLYWLLLTILLLVPDPLALLGIFRIPGGASTLGVHFLVFAVLGVLVSASRLPLRRVLLVGLLIGYAVATELLQSLVPPRDPSPLDLLENLLGVGVGITAWRVARERVFRKRNLP